MRTLARKRQYIADIYYEADPAIACEVFLVGEFTNPAWEVKIPMKYSYFHRAFKTQVKIEENCQFKFIVNGTFVVCSQYALTYTKEKFSNNIFQLNTSKNRKQGSLFGRINNLRLY
jgi:hypothetical protein